MIKSFFMSRTSTSLTQNEEHDIPSQVLKTIFDCMPQLFLDPNMCVVSGPFVLGWSQSVVVNWQN